MNDSVNMYVPLATLSNIIHELRIYENILRIYSEYSPYSEYSEQYRCSRVRPCQPLLSKSGIVEAEPQELL